MVDLTCTAYERRLSNMPINSPINERRITHDSRKSNKIQSWSTPELSYVIYGGTAGLDARNNRVKINLPTNQDSYGHSETTIEKLSKRRIQSRGVFFVSLFPAELCFGKSLIMDLQKRYTKAGYVSQRSFRRRSRILRNYLGLFAN